ncbi:conserved protein of unknown function [Acidithiobacillus ferrivorans]|jgi:hypothetical protein|uniref:Uncharacterized protein n=3 Tax=Acidithiobacillus TaxID=119977 RepID=A0A060UZ69_9PROT|nr:MULTISPECIES: hypothetical protein [Acidithiobacillus]AEM49066.1 hypothetical protein Acife_2992 [Acidithiobacillus ferrivorans SS3]MBU2815188.1 hypothetical protein [Acidithiobacillus ferruginosus]MBU2833135.1 hypothetical protein [Acidithiobacillus ferriphilus]MEB8475268.1 hypothetical protein [Acidithiobacillus ferriphilus]CDQ11774.1 conserved hypothetical protein [Acidithiobacillus ferrivorans]
MSADFYLGKLQELVGGTITELIRSGDDYGQDEFFGLVITMPTGLRKTLVFLADDEGNAPGRFEIAPDEASYALEHPATAAAATATSA